MAKEKQKIRADESVSLEFDGEKTTPRKFLATLHAFFDLVQEVGNQVAGEENAIELNVSVYQASKGIRVTPYVRRGILMPTTIESAIIVGVELLERNGDRVPPYFTIKALDDAAKLSHLGGTKDRRVFSKMNLVGSSKKIVPISPQTEATVDRLIRPKYTAYGSVEGELRGLKDEDDQSIKFQVRDEVNDDWIDCNVTEEWEQQILKYWKKRVSVAGQVHYNRDGFPNSITVEDVQELPGFDTLPPIETYRGLFVS